MTEQDIDAMVSEAHQRFDSVDPMGGGLDGLSQVRRRAAKRAGVSHSRVITGAVIVGLLAVAVPASAATGLLDPVINAFHQLGVVSPPGVPDRYIRIGQESLPSSGTVRLYVPGPASTQAEKASNCAYLEFLDSAGRHQGGSGWCAALAGTVDVNKSGTVTAIHLPDSAVTKASVSNGELTVVVGVTRGYCLLPVGFTVTTLVVKGLSASGELLGSWTVHAR